ncbi:hypothetical protein FZX02_05760 [Synechococcus sp. MU1644]|nr:hypothetical protein [Synechococcus sp. MU1644]
MRKCVNDVFGPAVDMAARLQVFARPMKIVSPISMKFDVIDGFQLDDIGGYAIKVLGDVERLNINNNLTKAR